MLCIGLRRAPIREGDLYRGEGLLDVSLINPMVACKCVFTRSGWVRRALTRDERLKAFDTPLSLFESMGECELARVAMERGISPLVGQSIVRAMWAGGKMGGKEDAEVETSRAGGARRIKRVQSRGHPRAAGGVRWRFGLRCRQQDG
jgi:hypothetical protein